MRYTPRFRRRSAVFRLERLEERTVLSTLTVLNALDSGLGSLRDAIKAARSGDTIDCTGLTGTITLTSGELEITKSLDIEGPGPDNLAISGNHASRVFNVSQNQKPVEVTIAGLKIENGLGSNGGQGGGILNISSTLTLSNDVMSKNVAVGNSSNGTFGWGGAVFNAHGATLAISGCTFSDNQALGSEGGRGEGGAIFNWKATANITDSTFTGNLAQGGDGGNVASSGLGLGGGLMNDVGTLAVSGCTFIGNQARGGSNIAARAGVVSLGNGGGGGLFTTGFATVTSSTFTSNKAVGGNFNTGGSGAQRIGNGFGGGIDTGGSLTVSGCTFTNNKAVGGNGNTGGVLTGDGLGGGLSNRGGGTATVTESTFTGNYAMGGTGAAGQNGGDGLGGGLYNDAFSTLTVTESRVGITVSGTIEPNYATGGAAGSGGSAGQGIGGGAYFADGGIVCLDSYTVKHIAKNHASTSNDNIFGSYTICPNC
jgi:hypothetical protein